MVLTAGACLPSPLYPDYQRPFGHDDRRPPAGAAAERAARRGRLMLLPAGRRSGLALHRPGRPRAGPGRRDRSRPGAHHPAPRPHRPHRRTAAREPGLRGGHRRGAGGLGPGRPVRTRHADHSLWAASGPAGVGVAPAEPDRARADGHARGRGTAAVAPHPPAHTTGPPLALSGRGTAGPPSYGSRTSTARSRRSLGSRPRPWPSRRGSRSTMWRGRLPRRPGGRPRWSRRRNRPHDTAHRGSESGELSSGPPVAGSRSRASCAL
ncbi:hypothetical protein SHXM_08045 [Streptomyces hygroscopicus]|nr:hypothetical protein SHXM_08045 [Streptomyces hygroscopicus]